jgi:hypothetical protein
MRPSSLLRVSPAACAAAWLILACAAPNALADSGGKPLVLDTQSGINDGQSGVVLQNAPLSHQPMVAAQPTAAPAGLPADSSPPIVVAPYINLPTGGASSPRPVYRPRPSGQ